MSEALHPSMGGLFEPVRGTAPLLSRAALLDDVLCGRKIPAGSVIIIGTNCSDRARRTAVRIAPGASLSRSAAESLAQHFFANCTSQVCSSQICAPRRASKFSSIERRPNCATAECGSNDRYATGRSERILFTSAYCHRITRRFPLEACAAEPRPGIAMA